MAPIGIDNDFVTNPDRSHHGEEINAADLRKAWTEVNETLTRALEGWRPEEWLERHAAISEADFVKEPHRNRLAVLLSRTNHAAYHDGQARLAR
jgi:hypothetical protein